MRMRFAAGIPAAALVAMLAVPGVALADPPVAPAVGEVTITWAIEDHGDGSDICYAHIDATLDPAYTKGRPVFATVTGSSYWDGVWNENTSDPMRLKKGTGPVHFEWGFIPSDYQVRWFQVDLLRDGQVISSSGHVATTNTCLN